MTFFYNLNKKLKEVAAAPKSEHKQLNERNMREGSIQGGVWTATPPKAGQPNVPVPQNPEVAKPMPKMPASAPAVGSAIRVDGKPLPTKEGAAMTPKQKKFAKLAPPADKITFADKIAGAKKEVDEMLGDVAANAIKKAVKGKQQVEGDFGPMEGGTGDYSAKKARAGKDIGKPGKAFAKIAKGAAERYGSEESGKRVAGAVLNKLRHKGANEGEMDEGWDDMMKDVKARAAKPKIGSIEHGHKHDIEHTATGRKVTRRTDDQGHSVGADDDTEGTPVKKGRGRPKGTSKGIGAKGPSGKSKLMTKEAGHESSELKAAAALLKKAGYKVTKAGEEELDEKAVSKKQQKFMGMVHATQKGEKAPSKEVAKVAKTMKKSDAEDFASTKHKGLPEKAPKKKEKTEEAGGASTPTASSGFSFGKGIYDSINRELEDMIAESMNISMSSNSDGADGADGAPSKSLTVTATDEDASYLAQILKSAGLGGGHGDSGCGCGTSPCSCGSDAEHVDENKPDWPTDTETSHDALQYSGGLNKPKTDVAGDGQTTVPVVATHDQDEDALRRLREMAGIKEAKKVEEDDVEEGNKFTGNLAKARAAGAKEADLDGDGDKEKVKESILDMSNLWKTYKG